MNHAEKVKATLVDTVDGLDRAGAGAYLLEEREACIYLTFICPCGCERFYSVPINSPHGRSWNWDNNVEAPTLTPSIRQMNGCKWHGFLTAGTWIPCDDSGR